MSLYRCAACGSPNVIAEKENGGYSYTKGAIGTIVLGVGGAVAGINGKTKQVFKCPDCGLTLNEPMVFELKNLIDIGVSSSYARKNLVLQGTKMSWESLKNKYKNIESGFADKSVDEQKSYINNILTSKASATKEEFNKALDTFIEFDLKYCSIIIDKNTVTKQLYLNALSSLNTIVENFYAFYPPAFRTDDLLINYQYKGHTIDIKQLFVQYAAQKYYDETGMIFVDQRTINDENKDFEYISSVNPFIREFAKAYKLMPYSEKDNRFFDRLYLSNFYDMTLFNVYQYKDTEIVAFKGSSTPFSGTLIIPRFRLHEESLEYWDGFKRREFTRSRKYSGPNFMYIIDNYLKYNPEKEKKYKKIIDEESQQYSCIMNTIEQESEKQKSFTQTIEHINREISEMEKNIDLLRRKIFRKAKAAAEIEQIYKNIRSKQAEIETAQKEIKKLQDISRQAYDKRYVFLYDFLKKYSNDFIVWHKIDE